ncbi:hypothetical protein [Streptomyces sp. NPDC001717]|uniref:hypothetical protein n=1 Tax=Streptomyces sp. NPDC001717 TaxID=3364604 RepID=UPI0036A2A89F
MLRQAVESTDASAGIAAAAAHHRLTGEAEPELRTFESLLATAKGPTHWCRPHAPRPRRPAAAGHRAAPDRPLRLDPHGGRRSTTRHHRVPRAAVPVLAELVSSSSVGLSALKARATIGEVPENRRSMLRAFAFSPLRLLGDTPASEETHPDEELRALAWRLLTDGWAGPAESSSVADREAVQGEAEQAFRPLSVFRPG